MAVFGQRSAMRIQVVEDHADSAHLLSRLFAGKGHDVRTVGTAGEALRLSDEVDFDLLVSDIGLPDGDGWQMLQCMRERRPVKAIAVSGFGMAKDIAKSRAVGFDLHLIKPVELVMLMKSVEDVMRRSQ